MIERIIKFTCPSCTKVIEFNEESPSSFEHENGIHFIDLGVLEYNSLYNGINMQFNVCDDCLHNWIESFDNLPECITKEKKQQEELKKAYDKNKSTNTD